jgi:hypothetical protein
VAELVFRALTVVLGVTLMVCLPWAMFWPERRPPYVFLVFMFVEITMFSIVWSAVWAQNHGIGLHWFAGPLRVLALSFAMAYLFYARRYYRRPGGRRSGGRGNLPQTPR